MQRRQRSHDSDLPTHRQRAGSPSPPGGSGASRTMTATGTWSGGGVSRSRNPPSALNLSQSMHHVSRRKVHTNLGPVAPTLVDLAVS